MIETLKVLFQNISWTAVWEGTKQAGRVVWAAVIPNILAGLDPKTGTVSINWRIVLVTAAIALIMWIDKIVHVVGKEIENASLIKGITRF